MTPERLHKRALNAINQRRYSDAITYCDRLIAADENFADAWFLKSMALVSLSKLEPAKAQLERAINLEPSNSEYLAQGAKIELATENLANAQTLAFKAIQQTSISPLSLDTVGVALTKLGQFEAAITALEQAVQKSPNNPQFRFNLGSAQQFIGNAEAAEQQYQQAILLNPKFARAYWALSELNKISDSSSALQNLEAATHDSSINTTDRLYFSHALAREYEKSGHYTQAFKILETAKTNFRPALNYTIDRDKRLFEALKKNFDKVKSSPHSSLGKNNIFIVGMPRTGTTLVDRILNGHSNIVSLGETQHLPIAIKKTVNPANISALPAMHFEEMREDHFNSIGNYYLDSLPKNQNPDGFVIDKTPLNFLNIGFICHSLPQAKIIVLRRNPLDTCLSNFRQLFSLSSPYYHYNYNLSDTAEYYCLFDQLIRYWQAKYPDKIHEVHYEEIVDKPREVASQLLTFCESKWEESCLHFYQNTGAVATASAMQVRQPINNKAIHRWHLYEEVLTPAIRVFERAGIDFD